MTSWVNLLGLIMSGVSIVLWLPQARATWAARNRPDALAAVSLGTQVLLLVNAVGWAVYGISTDAWWVAAPSLVNGPLAIVTIVFIMQVRHTPTLAWCQLHNLPIPHDWYCTAPPGYGTKVVCNGHYPIQGSSTPPPRLFHSPE